MLIFDDDSYVIYTVMLFTITQHLLQGRIVAYSGIR